MNVQVEGNLAENEIKNLILLFKIFFFKWNSNTIF